MDKNKYNFGLFKTFIEILYHFNSKFNEQMPQNWNIFCENSQFWTIRMSQGFISQFAIICPPSPQNQPRESFHIRYIHRCNVIHFPVPTDEFQFKRNSNKSKIYIFINVNTISDCGYEEEKRSEKKHTKALFNSYTPPFWFIQIQSWIEKIFILTC